MNPMYLKGQGALLFECRTGSSWAHVKHSLANLAGVALDRLAPLVHSRIKRLQHRPDVLDGFLAGAGLAIGLLPSSP